VLLLTLTTDKIQLVTSVAGDIDITASFTDRDQSTGVVGLSNKEQHTITTAATTDVVAVPGATTTRHVENLFICNASATITQTVTILFNANGTLYELNQAILYPGDALKYGPETGFKYLPVNGIPKASFWNSVMNDTADAEETRIGTGSSTELHKVPGLGVLGLQPGVRYSFFGIVPNRPSQTSCGGCLGGVVIPRGGTITDFIMDELHVFTPNVAAAALTEGSVTTQNARTIAHVNSDAAFTLSIITGTFLHSGSYGFSIQAGRESVASTNTFIGLQIGAFVHVWEAVG